MKKVTITRAELYSLVWREPLSSLVKNYTISYSELRKILRNLDIPIPENGHWSKLRFGKQVHIKPLPEDHPGNNEVEFNEREPDDFLISKNDQTFNKTDIESENIYNVPKKLTKPVILIVNTKEFKDAGGSFYWRFGHRFPERESVLDIHATKNTFQRALRIMDTLIKILRKRGHEISIKYGKTHAVVYGQEIEIKLREKYRVVDEPRGLYDSRNLEPTGILSFIIEPGHYRQKVINDGLDMLENKIEAIILKLEALGERKRVEHIKNEEWHRQYEEKQRIERELKERKNKEISDFKLVFQRAFRLHHANIIQDYVQSIEQQAQEKGELNDDLKDWIIWAKEKINWYNPLTNGEDDILDINDKTEIFKSFLKEWI